jgi:hypothetical protein
VAQDARETRTGGAAIVNIEVLVRDLLEAGSARVKLVEEAGGLREYGPVVGMAAEVISYYPRVA